MAGFAITEVNKFTSLNDPRFRHAVLKQIQNNFYFEKWKEFEHYPAKEQIQLVRVINNRAGRFITSPYLRGLFGSTKTTLNWEHIMNDRRLVLAQLAVGPISDKTLSFIGTSIIHQIRRVAMNRKHRRICFVLVDEFPNFISSEIAKTLDLLRGLKVYFILAHQNHEQIKEEYTRIYHSVMSDCRNKITFAISDHDAEIMHTELFADKKYQGMQEVKDEIIQTKQRSHSYIEDYETTTESEGETVLRDSGPGPTSKQTSVTYASRPITETEEYEEVSGRLFNSEADIREKLKLWIHAQSERHFQLKLNSLPTIPMRALGDGVSAFAQHFCPFVADCIHHFIGSDIP